MLSKTKFWYKVCKGNKGKVYYALSESFWKWIETEMSKTEMHGSKRSLARKIMKITDGDISQRAIENWIYRFNKDDKRKPIIIKDCETIKQRTPNSCLHGFRIFCPLCNRQIKDSIKPPVPFIWRTDKKGKIYVFDETWNELTNFLQSCESRGLLLSNTYNSFEINDRILRKWRNEGIKPRLYSRKEFGFNPENSYWLGLHFSDGHIRNNGSELSFTWQHGSSNPFQGYWFSQFVQTFMDIFGHKIKRSLTYVEGSISNNVWFFRTNISSLSPVFSKFLEKNKIIEIRKNTPTTGYSKHLPTTLIENFEYKDALLQGIMDGDGSYNISNEYGMNITLSLDPTVEYDFIHSLPLVPTTGVDMNEKHMSFKECNGNALREIRFAPSSLGSLSREYSAKNIIDQLEFMLRSAENSIRPDKVHKLIRIIKRVSSKDYGEYRSCLEVQKRIRDSIRERKLVKKTKKLEKRFPISNGYYKPFIPKWAECFVSKNEWKHGVWDFFLNGEFLVKKKYPKPEVLDFSNGVPVNFDMTLSARN